MTDSTRVALAAKAMKSLLVIGLGASIVAGCATNLRKVDVRAPSINCLFDPSCTVTVIDTTATIPLATGGTNFLQSRTFTGGPGSPAAGLTAYEYRVDLRNAMGITYIPCVSSLTVKFGPVVSSLDYDGDGTPDQVYVVTGGGLGSIGLASAVKDDGDIVFTFDSPVCAGGSPGTGQSSFFFGLVSAKPPVSVTATIRETMGTVRSVSARSAGQ